MYLKLLLYLAILAIITSHASGCQQIDFCRCRLKDGREINLHHLEKSVYKEIWSVDGLVYTFSPCTGVPCGPATKDVSVCVNNILGNSPKCLGNVTTAHFEDKGDRGTEVSLNYLAKDKVNTNSIVHLHCATSEKFEVSSKFNDTTYEFKLYSPCACPNGCMPIYPAISTGTVLLLTFFSCLLLYFGVGSLYRKSVYGAEGREMIPNTYFWFSLPGLVKDGYLFFISPCLGDRVEYRTYDKL